jgi:tryptophan 2,3-dioxygenase
MLANDRQSIMENPLSSPEQKEAQLEEVAKSVLHYNSLFDEEAYEELRKSGQRHLSYRAMKAALLIHLYQDEPILQLPFSLLDTLVDVDERLTQWRHRHSLMVSETCSCVSVFVCAYLC